MGDKNPFNIFSVSDLLQKYDLSFGAYLFWKHKKKTHYTSDCVVPVATDWLQSIFVWGINLNLLFIDSWKSCWTESFFFLNLTYVYVYLECKTVTTALQISSFHNSLLLTEKSKQSIEINIEVLKITRQLLWMNSHEKLKKYLPLFDF